MKLINLLIKTNRRKKDRLYVYPFSFFIRSELIKILIPINVTTARQSPSFLYRRIKLNEKCLNLTGILLLNKPRGLTSHDCVFKIRKLLKTKKVGHTGTLDPDVSGVLPICVGRATKIAEYLSGANKTYEGEVTIGYSTTTEDSSGDIVDEKQVNRELTRFEIENVFSNLLGEINQTPPMYSAVKINGKRLYEYAREGITVERPSRTITIYELLLLEEGDLFKGDNISFRFRVTCSKGTYVRTLAVMIGEMLGFPAHMSDLTRVSSGSFSIDQCLSFSEIEEKIDNQIIGQFIEPIESALSHLPKLKINDTVAKKVKNGAVLPFPDELSHLQASEPFVVIDNENSCIAIYNRHQSKSHLMKPVKVLVNNQELRT